jgi:hypothetical protein
MHGRRNPLLPSLCLAGLVALTSAAHAQSIEPGLWEFTSKMSMPNNPEFEQQMAMLQAQLKNLPPEARQMMEQSMGVKMLDDGFTKIRTCVSPEQADDPINTAAANDECSFKETGRSSNTISGRISCPSASTEGEFTTTMHSKKHFVTVAKMTGPQGQINVNNEARFISSDCGSLGG